VATAGARVPEFLTDAVAREAVAFQVAACSGADDSRTFGPLPRIGLGPDWPWPAEKVVSRTVGRSWSHGS